ncbi:hypothetical protein HPB50_011779 [Hyalomma asiaticum]|uniref:Uncharacterized protein n=1 Tax=Hyalomma asiaticum TaxID=266040 RepID=A0ACB7S6E6_HYAAI|nr:hypothetical protein HPB50_011779 [Hyalomma asiaticum]
MSENFDSNERPSKEDFASNSDAGSHIDELFVDGNRRQESPPEREPQGLETVASDDDYSVRKSSRTPVKTPREDFYGGNEHTAGETRSQRGKLLGMVFAKRWAAPHDNSALRRLEHCHGLECTQRTRCWFACVYTSDERC